MKKFIVLILVVLTIVVSLFAKNIIDIPNFIKRAENTKGQKQENNKKDKPSNKESSFDKTKHSLTDPNSIWVVVNKKRGIDTSFVPELTVPNVKLRLSAAAEQMQFSKLAEPALLELFESAKNNNTPLVFGSGYRSALTQAEFYNSYEARDGQEAADTYSARPGHSEHQTGLSTDITSPDGKCHLEICWADTPEGQWLAKNSYKYGFIIRYPKDKQDITGYQYEPWHIRYVGKELAKELHSSNKTLEEFFDLGPATNYN